MAITKGGRITFGFEEFDNGILKLQILRTRRGTFIDRLTLPSLRNYIVKSMNKYGRHAETLARSSGWSPYHTGRLVQSIKWISARRTGFTGLIQGALSVGVPYGRRQEFEHKTRGQYLHRAIAAVHPFFLKEIRNKHKIEEILLGTRRDPGGDFTPGVDEVF